MTDQIKCHGDVSGGGVFRFGQPTWEAREREPYVTGFRHCSYCGSLHPEDLITAIEAGAVLGGADWKYGWPHKFYVTVPNKIAGKVVEMGGTSGPNINGDTPGAVWKSTCGHSDCTERSSGHGYWKLPSMEPAPATCHVKFYNEHLSDCGPELLARLASLLKQHTGIEFRMDHERGLGYSAPAPGYQR